MIKEDFYTGEPVITGSLPNFSNNQVIVDPQELEAAQMASFATAKYDLDPSIRSPIIPGGYGYNGIGIGAQPPGYTPYGNPVPTYGQYYGYGGYNPYYQQPQQQYPQQQPTYHISGVGYNGEFLPSPDYQEKIDAMKMEYWSKIQEQEAKNEVDRQTSVYNNGWNYGFNYYGTPYYNQYQYNSINNELAQQIRDMENEARENRLALDMKISKLAHNFIGDNIADSDIEKRYRGVDVEIPRGYMTSVQDYREQAMFENLVEVDNSGMYRQFHAKVSDDFHKIISEDADLKDTFANMGVVEAQWEMEEEMHRRRNAGSLYNSSDNSYKYFVRSKAKERYAREKGIVMPSSAQANFDVNQMRSNYIQSLPTLQGATLKDDGTLTLPVPFGSKVGQMYSVHNSKESEYDEKRERFKGYLDNIKGNLYLDQMKGQKLERYNYG